MLRKGHPLSKFFDSLPKLKYNEADVITSMAYDTKFGIYDHEHDPDGNPLATVALHEKEKYYELSGLYSAMKRFRTQNLGERAGLSLVEYLDLPMYVHTMLTEQFTDEVKEHDRLRNELNSKEGKDDGVDSAMQPLRKRV